MVEDWQQLEAYLATGMQQCAGTTIVRGLAPTHHDDVICVDELVDGVPYLSRKLQKWRD